MPSVELLGAGIDRGLDEPVLERVAQCTLLVTDGTRQEPNHSIGNDGRRQFTASEDVIPDSDFACDEVLADAVVHALVVSAQDHQVLLERQGVCHGLVELLPVGRGEDDFVIIALAFQFLHASPHGLNLHDHSGFPAERVVIDLAVLAQAPVSQVVDVDFHESFVLCALQDGAVQWRVERLGHDGEYIYSHLYFNQVESIVVLAVESGLRMLFVSILVVPRINPLRVAREPALADTFLLFFHLLDAPETGERSHAQ